MAAQEQGEEDPQRHSFGALLRMAREDRNLSEAELGLKAEYGQGKERDAYKRIHDIETGKTHPQLSNYKKLCDALELSREERRRLHWAYVEGEEEEETAEQPAPSQLRQLMVDAAKPPPPYPKDDWEQWRLEPERTKYMLGLLVGSCAGLIHCAEVRGRLPYPTPGTWDPEKIFSDLTGAATASRLVDWTYNINFMIYGEGFFLNKVQSNVRSIFEDVVNEWLKTRWQKSRAALDDILKNDVDVRLKALIDPENSGEHDFHPAIVSGVDMLAGGSEACRTIHMVVAMLDAWRRHLTEDAFRPNASWSDLENMFNRIATSEEEQARCVAMVVTRARVMEHRERGIFREGLGFPVEWVITAKAAIVVGNFWRHMLVDIGRASIPPDEAWGQSLFTAGRIDGGQSAHRGTPGR